MLGRNTEHTRTLRKTLVCSLLLSILLITLLNIKSVYAQTITVTPSSVSNPYILSPISVSGLGFSTSDTSCTISGVPVAFNPAPTCTISGGSGSPTGSFFVRSTVQAGNYQITVTGIPGPGTPPVPDSASATFTINLSLNP